MGVSVKLEPNTSCSCWLFFLLPLSAASWLSPGMATVATAVVDMATATDMAMDMATVMDTAMERGRLSLPLLLSLDMDTTAWIRSRIRTWVRPWLWLRRLRTPRLRLRQEGG